MDIDTLPDIINPGQTVAACVPYTKRKKEWIVASVVTWHPNEKQYIVRDLFPENKKKQVCWPVKPNELTVFPASESELYFPNDNVLSLWLENEEWSSMFYEAVVVDSEEKFVNLKFNGDENMFKIAKEKVVKLPKRNSERPLPDTKDSIKKVKPKEEQQLNGKIEGKRLVKHDDMNPKSTKKSRLSPESSNSELNAVDTRPDASNYDDVIVVTTPPSALSPVYKPQYSQPYNNTQVIYRTGYSVLEKKILKYQQLLAIRQQQSNKCE